MKELMNGGNQVFKENDNVVIGIFKNGHPLQVSKQFLNPISDEEFGNWDCDKINTNIEELILSIECSVFGLSNYNTDDFNNAKYNIAPELIGKMNFIYDINMVSPYYDGSILLKVTDNNDGTVGIGLVFEPSAEDKEAIKKELAELNAVYFMPIE